MVMKARRYIVLVLTMAGVAVAPAAARAASSTELVPGDTNSQRPAETEVYVRDRAEGTTTLASISASGEEADRYAYSDSHGGHSISADGRYVLFLSLADNLVSGDTNGQEDLF